MKRKLFCLLGSILITCSLFGSTCLAAGSFRKSIGATDLLAQHIYLGHPTNVSALFTDKGMEEDKLTYRSEDTDILTVDRYGNVEGIKEGVCKLQAKDGRKEETITVVVTTFNDNRIATYETKLDSEKRKLQDSWMLASSEEVKEYVNTICDMYNLISYKGIYYDSDFPLSMDRYYDCWSFAAEGDSVIVARRGVCCDIANAAAYALQYDYEDQGFIFMAGQNGHIFNYFYEDGKYYVVDFTRAISAVRDGQKVKKEINTFKSLDELKKYVIKEYAYDAIAGIYMFSAMGHDFQPATKLAYCHEGFFESDEKWIGLEPVVYDNMITIWTNPDVEFEVRKIPLEEIPAGVPTYEERKKLTDGDRCSLGELYDKN